MSSPTESDIPSIEVVHVRLILLHDANSSFHLDIPLDIIESLCLKPLKYLLFLGWCILGVEGVLAYEHDGVELALMEIWVNAIYTIYYIRPENADTFSLTMPLLLCAQNTYDVQSV